MKQKPQTNELSKGMPGPIPAWQTEKNCAEADNAYGHEAPCLHDTPKNDERRNETAIDEDAQNAVERQEAYFLRLVKKAQAKMADLVKAKKAKIIGNGAKLEEIIACLDNFDLWVNIVTPN